MGFQEIIGIEVINAEYGYAVLKLAITEHVLQPFGYLHGGVSVALAEHAASIGASHSIQADEIVFGQEINANHLQSVKKGELIAEAIAIHLGKTSQVWEIRITDNDERLVCISRCTIAVRKSRSEV